MIFQGAPISIRHAGHVGHQPSQVAIVSGVRVDEKTAIRFANADEDG
jgi:hypothetical protein